MQCFSQVIDPVLVLVAADVLDDVSLQEPHLVRNDVVPGLDRLFDVMVATHLIVIGSHGLPQRLVKTVNQGAC
jgi:hypothetical protein